MEIYGSRKQNSHLKLNKHKIWESFCRGFSTRVSLTINNVWENQQVQQHGFLQNMEISQSLPLQKCYQNKDVNSVVSGLVFLQQTLLSSMTA